ncbi:putative sugar phosphate transporter domain-containing protein [Lupinus albus]|uniref:Putative sugar phosphate transporter domain-containing protein n=1 Tax=Lupinus albus TaxID=3870 RepID=A0A6A4PWZ4_LUPAL|nr:putative sugar phosphate transporter domain-containing protein [Lupinus albus]
MEDSIICHWSVFRSLLAILQWWAFNVTVIIMNKWIFQKLEFKFPLSVSCIHFICSSIGAYVVIKVLKLKPLIHVDPEDRWRRIFPMSFVFCINIVLGNVSLRYIPVSFMQTIKSFTPATTVILQWVVWRKYFDWRIWASLVPIVGGILLASFTELSFNMFGFCAALFGCLATSTKTILAESLLHGYKFDRLSCYLWVCNAHFLWWTTVFVTTTVTLFIHLFLGFEELELANSFINTVYYMAPFATMILAIPAMLLEGNGILEWLSIHPYPWSALIIILTSGILAFCLNFSIFYVIHSTTAVTFNVAGNLKVAVAVLVSWLIFRNPISYLNSVGCAVTLVGCTFYGYVRHKISQQPSVPGTPRTPRTPRTPMSKMELLPLVNDKLDDKV